MCYAFIIALALAATGGDEKTILLARLESEQLDPDKEAVSNPILTPDATSIVYSKDDMVHKVRQWIIWDIKSKSKTTLTEGADSSSGGFMSPDRQSLLHFIGRKKQGDQVFDVDAFVWDIKSKSKTTLLNLKSQSGIGLWWKFSQDGNILAISDCITSRVHVWERDASAKWKASTKTLELTRRANTKLYSLMGMAFSPDGKQIFVQYKLESKEWTIEKLDIASGKTLHFPVKPFKNHDVCPGLTISRDGETLWVNDNEEGTIGIDTSSGKKIFAFPSDTIGTIISPDGLTYAYMENLLEKTIVFRNVGDGSKHRTVKLDAYNSHYASGIFTADSRFFIASAGKDDRRIDIIDVQKAKIHSSLNVDSPIRDIFLLESGDIGVVGVEPKAIRIWKFKPPTAEQARTGNESSNKKKGSSGI
jgi:WD40 repeat protein